ncbi:response regulator [Psychromonas sp. Urea-02u-13]|uniref:response regulator n=1 Tax=Psychromonas sp. Urea-02u-13 TaxID=2058326 RepID=UPI0012FF05BB|nr:response regulator [Psychromonas sp. Urea-02u-13]
MLAHNIPSVIFTGKLDDSFRKKIYTKGIVDYVLKEGPANVEYVVSLLSQLKRTCELDVLVVDDSNSIRSYIKHLLVIYQFNVLEAVDGVDALEKIQQHPNISLVLTDFNMPNMDGLELTKQIRRKHRSQHMAIIGMSAFGNNQLSEHFLKLGGSDFITKPFLEEEFFCRINQNMALLEHIKKLKFLATRDFLM